MTRTNAVGFGPYLKAWVRLPEGRSAGLVSANLFVTSGQEEPSPNGRYRFALVPWVGILVIMVTIDRGMLPDRLRMSNEAYRPAMYCWSSEASASSSSRRDLTTSPTLMIPTISPLSSTGRWRMRWLVMICIRR